MNFVTGFAIFFSSESQPSGVTGSLVQELGREPGINKLRWTRLMVQYSEASPRTAKISDKEYVP